MGKMSYIHHSWIPMQLWQRFQEGRGHVQGHQGFSCSATSDSIALVNWLIAEKGYAPLSPFCSVLGQLTSTC